MSQKSHEPRYTSSKFDCSCDKCGGKIKREDEIYFDPTKKKLRVQCLKCKPKPSKR